MGNLSRKTLGGDSTTARPRVDCHLHTAAFSCDASATLEGYLDGIERFNFGGTCYANNYYLHTLLQHLGFDVRLCGADMNNPDVHLVSIVALESREHLVDVGYAAPFFEPLPRDLERDLVIDFGRCRYVLRPTDGLGRSRLDMYRDGELTHGYLAKPEPRSIDEFDGVIRGSYRSSANFMKNSCLFRRSALENI